MNPCFVDSIVTINGTGPIHGVDEPLTGYWVFTLGYPNREVEVTNHGRIDMAVRFNARIFLFEFKVIELTPDGRALAQLKERAYADKYRACGEPIYLIGMEFSKATRSMVGFDVELA